MLGDWQGCLRGTIGDMITTRTWILIVSASTLALLHLFAIAFELYWLFWWFDIFMHLFGGVVVALTLYALSDLTRQIPAWLLDGGPFMLAVIAVAMGWELFELWAGVPMYGVYALDTSLDILMGTIGGAVGWYLGRSLATL